MDKLKSSALILLMSVFFITGRANSQSNSTYNFLKLDIGARASALGGSFTSNLDDVNSVFYNPAALSTLTSKQASVGFYKYLLDINSGNLAFSQRYKDIGYIGGGIRYINYGSFEKFDEQSNSLGTFSANEIAISLGYSNIHKNNFHYGINLKFIYSGIDEFSSTAIGADLGVLYTIPESQWNFGLSLLNAGVQMSEYGDTKENLPVDLRFGVSKKLEHLPLRVHFEIDDLSAAQDDLFDRFKNLSIGGEFDFSDNVKFRVGYNNSERQDLKTGSSLGIAGFSAGLGFKILGNYSLDYAFNSLGNVGSTHRIDVGFNWK